MSSHLTNLKPQVLSKQTTDTTVSLDLLLQPTLACFQGHFPEIAILPGVVQLDWALHFGVQVLTLDSVVDCVKNLRFQKVLLAKDEVCLRVEKRTSTMFTFEYVRSQQLCSSGQIFVR